MSDRELYQKIILEHNNKPRNEGVIVNPTHHNKSYNPFCGDEIDLYLIIEDGRVLDVKHKSFGCSISRASASMMSEAVKDLKVDAIKMLFEDFHSLLKGLSDKELMERLGKLSVFSGVWNYPARVKCAMLGWYSLMASLEGTKEAIIEEK